MDINLYDNKPQELSREDIRVAGNFMDSHRIVYNQKALQSFALYLEKHFLPNPEMINFLEWMKETGLTKETLTFLK